MENSNSPSPTKNGRFGEVLILLLVAIFVGIGVPTLINTNVAAKQPAVEQGIVKINPGFGAEFDGGNPISIEIPHIGKNFPIDNLELNSESALVPPDDVERIGWWAKSATPGSKVGQAIYAGHSTRSQAPEAGLNSLESVPLYSMIIVRTEKAEFIYSVSRLETADRNNLSTKQNDFFSQTGNTGGRLVLITCGEWNGKEYLKNIFLFADLVEIKEI